MTFRVLILGGTRDGRELSARVPYERLLSYAGRTDNPRLPEGVPCRVGGFGGVEGLRAFLRDYDALVDATHPFAARISANAVEAARLARVPLLRLERPAWQRRPGDRWVEVSTMREAVDALGREPRRVLLTIGRQEVPVFRAAPQHHYLVRAIDAFETGLPHAQVLPARGPFTREGELALLREVDVLVSKNAGGDDTAAKLQAARELALPVVMVARPAVPDAPCVGSVDEALARLAQLARAHERSSSQRGE